jgi:hypothetical protein
VPYEFRKVYLDLITDTGEVCVLYLTWVRFRERWHGQASLEHYDRGGGRTLIHATGVPPMMDFERGLEHLPQAIEVPGGEITVEVKPVHDGWEPTVVSPCPDLLWSIAALRTRARIEWPGPRGPISLRGDGYVDFVRLTCATRKLGLRSLHWVEPTSSSAPWRSRLWTSRGTNVGTWVSPGCTADPRAATATSTSRSITARGPAWCALARAVSTCA